MSGTGDVPIRSIHGPGEGLYAVVKLDSMWNTSDGSYGSYK